MAQRAIITKASDAIRTTLGKKPGTGEGGQLVDFVGNQAYDKQVRRPPLRLVCLEYVQAVLRGDPTAM